MSISHIITRQDYIDRKHTGDKIVMLTAYDAAFAGIMELSGEIDVILVGDSLGMVVQGHDTTRKVSLDHMLYHTEIVCRAAPSIPIIADMPFHTFDDPAEALKNAEALIKTGADGVKIEGNKAEVVRRITGGGIPLMGHLGLLPQTAVQFKVQGKDEAAAEKLMNDAVELEKNGAVAIVLECVPRSLAASVSAALRIPTIGIGAGPDCDGQVLVLHDMLGLNHGHLPKFVKQYSQLGELTRNAISEYSREVKNGTFPSDSHSYH